MSPPGENERAAAQAKENYISRHEQVTEKEGEYYKKRRERER